MLRPDFVPATLAAAICAVAPQALAASVNTTPAIVLHDFQGFPSDGSNPIGSLTFGPNFTLLGTTLYGGSSNGGTVFQLTPPSDGGTGWTETLLHSFGGADGAFPNSTLIADASGNFYGVTQIGGANGLGVVYEISPPVDGGSWNFSVLHSFAGPDGATPYARLAIDTSGTLYGLTAYGGTAWTSGSFSGQGVVYELSPPRGGQTGWTETVIHDFSGSDGQAPIGGLAVDATGRLYGATSGGGACCGTVFQLVPPGNGQTGWTLNLLHNFDSADGYAPNSSITIDAAGNIYGSALDGGAHGHGDVFKLTPPARGATAWPFTIIHSYTGAYGSNPYSDLTLDGAGDVFLTTPNGGHAQHGGVFEFTPPAGAHGKWAETVFLGGKAAGTNPVSGVILDASGNIYGMASKGGSGGYGTVFELR